MGSKTSAAITILGLFLAALPIAQAQGGNPNEITHQDPKGDASPLGITGGSPVQQPTPLTDAADLTSFRLYGEDQEGLYVEFGVNNIKPPTPPTFDFSQYAQYTLQFKLDGSAISYRATLSVSATMARTPTGIVPVPARFCVEEGSRSGGGGSCVSQRVFASLDWEKSLFTVYITKASLMGQDSVGDVSRGLASAPRVELGARLTEIRINSNSGSGMALQMSDTLPNTGALGPYVMVTNAANDRLRLRLNNEAPPKPGDQWSSLWGTTIHDFPTASVSPGTTSLIQVAVENWNSGKRLINLSAGLVDPKDESKWETRIVSTITVPGETKRIVNLIVNLTGSVEHRSTALARVSARSLGFADEIGSLKIRLIAAVPPSPTAKTLFFHAGGTPPSPTTLCFGGCGQTAWLNTLEQDPKGTSDAATSLPSQRSGGLSGAEYWRAFALDAPLNTDLVLDTRSPIKATLTFIGKTPTASGTGKLELSAGELFIGSGEAAWSGSGPVEISFTPNLEAERVPQGSVLTARVLIGVPPGPSSVFGIDPVRPDFAPKSSKIELPIIKDPKPPAKSAIPAGPAFLSLESEGDTEQFVNPGKVRVFKLTVVNEGVQEDVVKLQPTRDNEDWYVAIKPSDSYRLKPGESASFGVLVKAPKDAKEGEQMLILLNATSKADPSALAQATLTAIVTTGVEIEDEAENFTADEDTLIRIEEAPAKKSPGVGFALAISVSALAFALRRRRGPA